MQRELSRLVCSGLVTVERIGSQKHSQANPASPLFNGLCAILNKTVALVELLKVALEPILPVIELAFLFGSVAKGEDTASSDIDLMIINDSHRSQYGERTGMLRVAVCKLMNTQLTVSSVSSTKIAIATARSPERSVSL